MKQYVLQNAGLLVAVFTLASYRWSKRKFPGPYSKNTCALFLLWLLLAQPFDVHSTYLIGSYINFSTYTFEVNPINRFLFENIGFFPTTFIMKMIAIVLGIMLFRVRDAIALAVVAIITFVVVISNYLQYYLSAL